MVSGFSFYSLTETSVVESEAVDMTTAYWDGDSVSLWTDDE